MPSPGFRLVWLVNAKSMPLVHSENITEACHLLVWQLTETEEDLRKMLPSSADFDELSTISHPQKKREWMAGRIVLAHIVAESGGTFKGTWKDEHGGEEHQRAPHGVQQDRVDAPGACVVDGGAGSRRWPAPR